MKETEILNLKGRELDALIAKHVMGWEIGIGGDLAHNKEVGISYAIDKEYLSLAFVQGFFPSTDIAAAWKVVEKMQADGWMFKMVSCIDDCEATFLYEVPKTAGSKWVWHEAYGEDDPCTICHAALIAIMDQKKDE